MPASHQQRPASPSASRTLRTPASRRAFLGLCTLLVGWGLLFSYASAQQLLTGHNKGLPPTPSTGGEAQWFLDLDSGNIWYKTSGQWGTSGSFTLANIPYSIYDSTVINPGTGAVPGDLITLAISGAVATTPAILPVSQTQVVAATVASNGTGCTPGTYVASGTTGITGPSFRISLQVLSSGAVNVISINNSGVYSQNPINITNEPVSGMPGCSVQPALSVTMGVLSLGVTGPAQGGIFTSLPASPIIATIGSTTGTEVGTTFSPKFAAAAAVTIPASQSQLTTTGSAAFNYGAGYNALAGCTTCVEDTAVGWQSQAFMQGGKFNVSFGTATLWHDTTATYTTAIGGDSARNYSGRQYFTGLGRDSIRNTIGARVIGVGYGALGAFNNAGIDVGTGIAVNDMIGIGYLAGDSNNMVPTNNPAWVANTPLADHAYVSATGNIYRETIASCTTGNSTPTWTTGTGIVDNNCLWDYVDTAAFGVLRDTFIGNYSGSVVVDGQDDTSNGFNTFLALTTGSSDTVMGSNAGASITTGNSNTAMGYYALNSDVTGGSETAIGAQALVNSTGSFNTAVGALAAYSFVSSYPITAVGYASLKNATAANNAALGLSSCLGIVGGANNDCFGNNTLSKVDGTSAGNIAIGEGVLVGNATTPPVITNTTAIGLNSMSSTSLGAITGSTAVGANALASLTSGNNNTAIGVNSLTADATTTYSTAVGAYALAANTGGFNTAVGGLAAQNFGSGNPISAFGYSALNLATGVNNAAFGFNAAATITTGTFNDAFGNNALKKVSGTSNNNAVFGDNAMIGNTTTPPVVSNNVVVGAQAMSNTALAAAINNVVIGSSTGTGITSAFNNTIIGYHSGTSLTTGSREILIGTDSNCDVGSGSETDTLKVCESSGGGALIKGNLTAAAPEVTVGGPLQLASYTVASLPTCAAGYAGAIAYVTDANAPSYNATLTGSGTTKTLAMCNGTNWTAH